jgi:hypothetical protein
MLALRNSGQGQGSEVPGTFFACSPAGAAREPGRLGHQRAIQRAKVGSLDDSK